MMEHHKDSQSPESASEAEASQDTEFPELAFRMLELQTQAASLGMFLDERELLQCEGCGLTEDIDSDSRLCTTFRENLGGPDTGLRFTDLGGDSFRCPHCDCVIKLISENPEDGEMYPPK